MWNPSLAEFEKRSHKLTPGQFFALPKGIKNKPEKGFGLQVRDGDFIEFEFKTRH